MPETLDYRPLDVDRNEIRLLQFIKPASPGAGDDLIACSLRHLSLNDLTDRYAELMARYGGQLSSASLSLVWLVLNGIPTKRDVPKPFIWMLSEAGVTLDDIPADWFEGAAAQPRPEYYRDRYTWGDFAALSYEWGDLHEKADIVVDGKRVPVTKNLESALRGIATWWFDSDGIGDAERRYIWVDALCINQKDLSERNAQVKRMADLYRVAWIVLAWTGPSPTFGKNTEKLLGEITKDVATELLKDNYQTVHTVMTCPRVATAKLTVENAEGWQGLIELSMRPYWKRLWIIQEVLLANHNALVCFGDQRSRLNFFLVVVSTLLKSFDTYIDMLRGDPDHQALLDKSSWTDSTGQIPFAYIIDSKADQGATRPRPDLMRLLYGIGRAQQRDARDKIYGILGLVDTSISDALVIDYEKPVSQIYREFALATIQATGKVDIIYQRVVDPESESCLPSWVPDWCSGVKSEGPMAFWENNSDQIAPYQLRKCKASGDAMHIFEEAEDPTSLICQGFQYDTIDGLACGIQAHLPHDEHEVVTRKSRSPSLKAHSIAGVRKLFWDTLLLHTHRLRQPEDLLKMQKIPFMVGKIDEIYTGHNPFFIETFEAFQRCNQDFNIRGHSLVSCFEEFTDSDEQKAIFSDRRGKFRGLLNSLLIHLLSRRMATSEKDHLVLVPRATEQGDGVYILKGCNVPLILRRNDDRSHTLVGECYIRDIMNGEALEYQQENGIEDVTIVLR